MIFSSRRKEHFFQPIKTKKEPEADRKSIVSSLFIRINRFAGFGVNLAKEYLKWNYWKNQLQIRRIFQK